MKKTLSVILAILICATVLAAAGCSQEQQPTADTTPLGPYSPTLSMTFAFPYHGCNANTFSKYEWTEEDNGWTRLIRQELNIKLKLEWSIHDPAAYFEKMDASIMMGKVPDLINCNIGEQYAYSYLKKLNNQDMLADLTDLYSYMSEPVSDSIERAGAEVLYPCTFNGRLKGVPQVYYSAETAPNVFWVRQDWLDNVNKKVPTNYEEFVDVITAFTNQDPDGDGLKNTYGFTVALNPGGEDKLTFACYGAYPYTWLKDDDGNLVYGSIQPEMKTALSELRDLYAAGCLDPNFNGTRYTDCFNGVCGMLPEWFGKILDLDDKMKQIPSMDWVAFRGFSFTGEEFKTLIDQQGYRYYAVSKDFSNPEAIFKMMNLYEDMQAKSLTDNEIYETLFEDPDGVTHIRNSAPVMAGIFPEEPEYLCTKVIEAIETGDTSLLTNTSEQTAYDKCIDYINNGTLENYPYYKMYGPGGALNEIAKYDSSEYFTNSFVTAQTETMVEKMPELLTYEYLTFSNIVNGTADLNEFDNFVTEWLNKGGADIVREVNEWYDSLSA